MRQRAEVDALEPGVRAPALCQRRADLAEVVAREGVLPQRLAADVVERPHVLPGRGADLEYPRAAHRAAVAPDLPLVEAALAESVPHRRRAGQHADAEDLADVGEADGALHFPIPPANLKLQFRS